MFTCYFNHHQLAVLTMYASISRENWKNKRVDGKGNVGNPCTCIPDPKCTNALGQNAPNDSKCIKPVRGM